jgi:gliding motility-associated-like protein
MKNSLIIAGLSLLPYIVRSQVPFVQSISKTSAKASEVITLTGINFGTNATNIKVGFGGVTATPLTISDQLIEVSVPSGATFENVQVTNTSTGFAGFSREFLALSFGGAGSFDVSAMSSQNDFQSESGLYDLAVADLDGDGKVDMASANDNSTAISIFRNTGSPGVVNFVKTLLNPGVKTLHVAAGDLNNDGKPELIVSEVNGSRIFVFKNNSTPGNIVFTSSTIQLTSGSKASTIRIADVDANGKSDILVTDQSTSRFFVVPNQSTVSSLSFDSPVAITLAGTSGTDGIAVGDLDGDQFPEIVIGEFLNANGKIFIIKNQSSPGAITLNKISSSDIPSTLSNLRIGDLDGDSKLDIAGTLLLSASVLVMGNQSTSSEIKFSTPTIIGADDKPWGMDFGDVNGDGKVDIVVASITQKTISILSNTTSSIGNFTFQKQTKPTNFINRHIKIADIDNDSRPDFAFTSINDNNLGIVASKISIYRNINCVIPTITPIGPLTICNSFTQRLNSSLNGVATYEWFKGGVSLGAPGPDSFADITLTGSYTVTITSDAGSCVKSSAAVQVNVVSAAPLGVATPNTVAPVCLGSTLNLSANDVGATDYVWTNPSGTSKHGLSTAWTNFTASQAGKYTLDVLVGTCIAQRAFVVVDAVSIPTAAITFSGSDLVCEGQTKTLSLFPAPAGYTYQWVEQTRGLISGETSSSMTTSSSGKYLIRLTSIPNPSCAAIETTAKKIRIAKNPVVDFSFQTPVCQGVEIAFTDKSVIDVDTDDPEVNYKWDFGDATQSAVKNPAHTYTSAKSFPVKLVVAYRDNSCASSKQQALAILQAPTVAINSTSSLSSVCPEGNLELNVTGTFSAYKWSSGETTPSIKVNKAGVYTVEVTSGGCKISASKTIGLFNAPELTIQASATSINLGDKTSLSASGLETYLWRPNKNVSDSLASSTEATPSQTTTYVVSGKDKNGCNGEASIEIIVIPDNIFSLIHPVSYFSPNGDGINDVWKAESIQIFNECAVTIYDEKGLKLYEAKPYNNDWSGVTSKGQILPAGVYYYIIQCHGNSKVLSGSINIIR